MFCCQSEVLAVFEESGCGTHFSMLQGLLCVWYGTCHNKVSAERPGPFPFIRYARARIYLSNARARTCRTPVCVVLGRPFWKSAESVPEGANRSVCQHY